MAKPLIVLPGQGPHPLNVVGEKLTILASNDQTNSYEIFLQKGSADSGPPPHHHDWDESFYVLSGEIEFGVDEQTVVGTAGALVHVPRGTTHWFRFGKNGGEMLSMTSGPGASKFFTEVDRRIPPGAPDLATLAEIATSHGLTVIPPQEEPA